MCSGSMLMLSWHLQWEAGAVEDADYTYQGTCRASRRLKPLSASPLRSQGYGPSGYSMGVRKVPTSSIRSTYLYYGRRNVYQDYRTRRLQDKVATLPPPGGVFLFISHRCNIAT